MNFIPEWKRLLSNKNETSNCANCHLLLSSPNINLFSTFVLFDVRIKFELRKWSKKWSKLFITIQTGRRWTVWTRRHQLSSSSSFFDVIERFESNESQSSGECCFESRRCRKGKSSFSRDEKLFPGDCSSAEWIFASCDRGISYFPRNENDDRRSQWISWSPLSTNILFVSIFFWNSFVRSPVNIFSDLRFVFFRYLIGVITWWEMMKFFIHNVRGKSLSASPRPFMGHYVDSKSFENKVMKSLFSPITFK